MSALATKTVSQVNKGRFTNHTALYLGFIIFLKYDLFIVFSERTFPYGISGVATLDHQYTPAMRGAQPEPNTYSEKMALNRAFLSVKVCLYPGIF